MALLTILLLASACGNDGDATSTTEPQATGASPTSAPAERTAAPASARAVTSDTFQPTLTLQLGDGWQTVADLASEFAIEHDADVPGPTQAYVGAFNIGNVRSPDNFGELQPVPDDFIAWLAAHKDIIVTGGPIEVTVGGVSGTQLDVRVDTNYDVPLFDDFEFHFRDAARFIELDLPGENVVIVGGPFTQAYFEEAMAIAEPVLASVRFE
jgi:hypothetical protein